MNPIDTGFEGTGDRVGERSYNSLVRRVILKCREICRQKGVGLSDRYVDAYPVAGGGERRRCEIIGSKPRGHLRQRLRGWGNVFVDLVLHQKDDHFFERRKTSPRLVSGIDHNEDFLAC